MQATKISLSEDEMVLMRNSAWILTKNALLEKINVGLGGLANRMQQEVLQKIDLLPPEVLALGAKISRGEKYEGLPYLILDYPRLFGKDQILAIRTMFWWGNYCTTTLHIRGKYVDQVLGRMGIMSVLPCKLYLSFDGDEWNHDLHKGNYRLHEADTGTLHHTIPANPPFLKISYLSELDDWDKMEENLFKSFQNLLALLEGLAADAVEEVF